MCPLYREIVSPLSEVPLYHAALQYYPYYMYQYLRMAIVVEWGGGGRLGVGLSYVFVLWAIGLDKFCQNFEQNR